MRNSTSLSSKSMRQFRNEISAEIFSFVKQISLFLSLSVFSFHHDLWKLKIITGTLSKRRIVPHSLYSDFNKFIGSEASLFTPNHLTRDALTIVIERFLIFHRHILCIDCIALRPTRFECEPHLNGFGLPFEPFEVR